MAFANLGDGFSIAQHTGYRTSDKFSTTFLKAHRSVCVADKLSKTLESNQGATKQPTNLASHIIAEANRVAIDSAQEHTTIFCKELGKKLSTELAKKDLGYHYEDDIKKITAISLPAIKADLIQATALAQTYHNNPDIPDGTDLLQEIDNEQISRAIRSAYIENMITNSLMTNYNKRIAVMKYLLSSFGQPNDDEVNKIVSIVLPELINPTTEYEQMAKSAPENSSLTLHKKLGNAVSNFTSYFKGWYTNKVRDFVKENSDLLNEISASVMKSMDNALLGNSVVVNNAADLLTDIREVLITARQNLKHDDSLAIHIDELTKETVRLIKVVSRECNDHYYWFYKDSDQQEEGHDQGALEAMRRNKETLYTATTMALQEGIGSQALSASYSPSRGLNNGLLANHATMETRHILKMSNRIVGDCKEFIENKIIDLFSGSLHAMFTGNDSSGRRSQISSEQVNKFQSVIRRLIPKSIEADLSPTLYYEQFKQEVKDILEKNGHRINTIASKTTEIVGELDLRSISKDVLSSKVASMKQHINDEDSDVVCVALSSILNEIINIQNPSGAPSEATPVNELRLPRVGSRPSNAADTGAAARAVAAGASNDDNRSLDTVMHEIASCNRAVIKNNEDDNNEITGSMIKISDSVFARCSSCVENADRLQVLTPVSASTLTQRNKGYNILLSQIQACNSYRELCIGNLSEEVTQADRLINNLIGSNQSKEEVINLSIQHIDQIKKLLFSSLCTLAEVNSFEVLLANLFKTVSSKEIPKLTAEEFQDKQMGLFLAQAKYKEDQQPKDTYDTKATYVDLVALDNTLKNFLGDRMDDRLELSDCINYWFKATKLSDYWASRQLRTISNLN